jgi:deoxyadenosine/deoxycytidine kinase
MTQRIEHGVVQHLLGVVGNIASGKSTLVKALASSMHAPVEPERWFENPFLDATQRDPERFALAAEGWFVVEAAAAQARLEAIEGGILERPLDEHLAIFVADRLAAGQLTAEDAAALHHLGAGLRRTLRPFDLLIHLHAPAPELRRRIEARSRPFEWSLTIEVLARLERRYSSFIESAPQTVIDVDTTTIDVRTDIGIKEILDRVNSRLD